MTGLSRSRLNLPVEISGVVDARRSYPVVEAGGLVIQGKHRPAHVTEACNASNASFGLNRQGGADSAMVYRPAPASSTMRLVPTLRTEQRFSVRLHQRQRHLPTGADTQHVKHVAGVGRGSEHRPPYFNRVQLPSRDLASGPAVAIPRDGPLSFIGLHPCRTPRQMKESLPHFRSGSTTRRISPS